MRIMTTVLRTTQPISQLDAIEQLLAIKNKPMSSRDIAVALAGVEGVVLDGLTPWKTINARLSEDILKFAGQNIRSRFMRINHGLFALRRWSEYQEFVVKRHRVSPLNEVIRVVPKAAFAEAIAPFGKRGLLKVPFDGLLLSSVDMQRQEAEATEEFVQLIPSFVVRRADAYLHYSRTKKLPESRLHQTKSIVFGGHLQSSDVPPLFFNDEAVLQSFVFRELYEELAFSTPPSSISYAGSIYLTTSSFERQHVGVTFLVELASDCDATSEEPGYHANLAFLGGAEVLKSDIMDDSWSACVADHLINA